MTKSLLELARDLELIASDMKKDNDEYFRNIFGFAEDIRDKSQEFSGLAPAGGLSEDDKEAMDKELEWDGLQDEKIEEGFAHEETE